MPGTLDLLVLKVLTRGPQHGYRIAQYLLQTTDSFVNVGEGTLYPALQRLVVNGWATAEVGGGGREVLTDVYQRMQRVLGS